MYGASVADDGGFASGHGAPYTATRHSCDRGAIYKPVGSP